RAFGGYLRKKSRDKIAQQGPGWPALAESTQEKLEHTRTSRITARGKVRKSSEAAIWKKLRRELRIGRAGILAMRELSRLTGGGPNTDALARAYESSHSSSRDTYNQTLESLRTDLEKYGKKTAKQKRAGGRKSKKHKMLGRMGSTLAANV